MKEKRNRMALTWPYADPHFAAYMFAAAAAAYGQNPAACWGRFPTSQATMTNNAQVSPMGAALQSATNASVTGLGSPYQGNLSSRDHGSGGGGGESGSPSPTPAVGCNNLSSPPGLGGMVDGSMIRSLVMASHQQSAGPERMAPFMGMDSFLQSAAALSSLASQHSVSSAIPNSFSESFTTSASHQHNISLPSPGQSESAESVGADSCLASPTGSLEPDTGKLLHSQHQHHHHAEAQNVTNRKPSLFQPYKCDDK